MARPRHRQSAWLASLTIFICAVPLRAEGIPWRNGPRESEVRSPSEVLQTLETAREDGRPHHVLVTLAKPATPQIRAALRRQGITLLGPVSGKSFFAAVDATTLDVDGLLAEEAWRDVSPIQTEWKLHPSLTADEPPQWALVDAGDSGTLVAAYVLLHADVPLMPDGLEVLDRHGAEVQSSLNSVNAVMVYLPPGAVRDLASEDAVQWIEPPLPALQPTNDRNRELTQAEIVQTDPMYGLDGTGVSVMVYDAGVGDFTHPDFGGRLTPRDLSDVESHPTHVAGIVGGDGFASGGRFRGMAPAVTIQAYGVNGVYDPDLVPLFTDPFDLEMDYSDAITEHGISVANNSIGSNVCINLFDCAITGDYGLVSEIIDGIVRGALGRPVIVVWSGGNERNCDRCRQEGESTPEGYHSVVPPSGAKNHIAVGATNANDDSVAYFTSWGPTDDGRLKPDLMAPGCEVGDDFGVTSLAVGGGYLAQCGSSMSAPTVTGLIALLLQDFREQFPERDDPRNATVKALLAQNAVDLVHAGPDYQSGYGSVRIQETIDFMHTGRFLESELSQDEGHVMFVEVGADDAAIKLTLAWDDAPGTLNVAKALVNDLDLRVYDPSGQRHFPWTLDPRRPADPAVRVKPDRTNNIEQVFVDAPEAGLWLVQVFGFSVPTGPQPFSLCYSPQLSEDCDGNGLPDIDELLADPGLDCSGNGLLDKCEADCDGNGTADSCEIAAGLIDDCDFNGIADGCSDDCDGDGQPDECVFLSGVDDCNGNNVPDDCEADCNGNLVPDACDLLVGDSDDCDENGLPDECQDQSDDCNQNGFWDACETALGATDDFNGNGVPDECEDNSITVYVSTDDCRPPGAGSVDDPFCTIQDAIDTSISGQTIVVAPGVYRGERNRNLDFGGRTILLRSEDPSDRDVVAATIVDGEHAGRGFFFHSGESGEAAVDGITIRHGLASQGGTPGAMRGGAVYCRDASPTFRRCIISNNAVEPTIFSEFGGGGFYLERSTAVIDRCEITGNETSNLGGAIYCFQNSHAKIRSCLIAGNGAFLGGGIAMFASYPLIEHCTFADNNAGSRGGGIHCNQAAPTLRNSLLWGNSADGQKDQISCINPTVSYSDVEDGWPGTGNIDADPLFSAPHEDFHLTPDSPCVNAGDPLLPVSDAKDLDGEPRVSGGRTDMGADEVFDADCNDNGIPDDEDIASGTSGDCNSNDLPDECEDCNDNLIADSCDIDSGHSSDGNGNGVPDECEPTRSLIVDAKGPFDPAPGDPSLGDPNEDGSDEHPFDSIQEAIDASRNGDTVTIHPGLYRGDGNRDIDFTGKAITVRCRSTDPSVCVVDAEFVARGFVFETAEPRGAVLKNLTIRHGRADLGAGILCDGASPTIEHCHVVDNLAEVNGGGFHFNNSRALINGCLIRGNQAATFNGGGAYCNNSDPTFRHSVFRDNQAGFGGGAVFALSGSEPIVSNCEITGNVATRGGGLYASVATFRIESCTLADNRATLGRGHAIYAINSGVAVRSSILWGDVAPSPTSQVFSGSRALVLSSFSNVRGGEQGIEGTGSVQWLDGNIAFDPQFFDAAHRNYHLLPGSPCVDTGDAGTVLSLDATDLDGDARSINGRMDMGSDELDTDCNHNGQPDRVEIETGTSPDCNRNFYPDECEPDCDDNRIPDSCDIARGDDDDCNDNGVLDTCDRRSGLSKDDDGNGVLDECEDCRTDQDCADALFCNGIEACVNGICFPGEQPCLGLICREDTDTCVECLKDAECDDDNTCTNDACVEGACRYAANDSLCDDDTRCTLNDRCIAGECIGEIVPDCGAAFRIAAASVNGVPLPGGTTSRVRVHVGDEITCEILLENWQPQELALYQATLDSRSLASGALGGLAPLIEPSPSVGAFIDQSRPDYVFSSVQSITAVATSRPDYSFAALGLLQSVPDPGQPAYCGTIIITVPDEAAGVFSVSILGDPLYTFLSDRTAIALLPWEVQSLEIFVDTDCNGNGRPDDTDIATGVSADCTGNGLPDECETDCNENGVADSCDLLDDAAIDCNENDVPDECETDCNGNGVPDDCDIASEESLDCDENRIPDECDIRDRPERNCNDNDLPDRCEPDCNQNGEPDDCDIRDGISVDCDESGVPDECERDCNENGISDPCDVVDGLSADEDENGVPDECQRILQVPLKFDSIQDAIDDAFDGDTIELDNGAYTGSRNRNLEFHGKAVILRCKNEPGECVIDAEGLGRGFRIRNAEGPDTIIEGLVVTNATTGVQILAGASPTFVDCRFEGNQGSGVFLSGAGEATFRRCRFLGNGGHGLLSSVSNPVAEDSLFADNGGRGVLFRFGDGMTMRNCTVTGNASGVAFVSGESYLRNTIVHGDRADGTTMIVQSAAVVTVEHSDIEGAADAVSVDGSSELVWGDGNIDVDPKFADADGPDDDIDTWEDNDRRLSPQSACIDRGHPEDFNLPGRFDINGEERVRFDAVDIGADESDIFLDCNANGRLDAHDYTFADGTDCNANGIPDDCDIAELTSLDCDGNELPDECDVRRIVRLESPALSPFGGDAPQSFTMDSPPPAYGGVRVTLLASSDLNGTSEYVDVHFNGIRVGSVFKNRGSDCAATPDEAILLVPYEIFNDAVDGGDLHIELIATSAVNAARCRNGTSIAVTLEYEAVASEPDCDRNGTPDRCEPGVIGITGSSPASGAIDARQPHPIADAALPQGLDVLELTFNCYLGRPSPADFVITTGSSERAAPQVEAVSMLDGVTVRLELEGPIPAGTWTLVTHLPTGESVCLGSLPGDVSGDRTSSVPDIAALIDSINGVEGKVRPDYATDIDHSGVTGPSDILRIIDLLNGAGSFEPWLGRTLPASPCD